MTTRVIGAGELAELPPDVRETVVTVGTFDGVHLGHRDVLERLVARARGTSGASVLVTFDPHPLEVLNPAAAPLLLTTRAEKLAIVAATGLDFLVVLPFTTALALHSAEQFVDRILLARFRMAQLLIGHDHGFGRGREGDLTLLQRIGAERGFVVDPVPPVVSPAGDVISSTLVRRAVVAGDLAAAAALLGRQYSAMGTVVAGDGRGRLLGYPTLNVEPGSPRKLLPPDGVYAVRVTGSRGAFDGMMNLGGRPTFRDARRTLEVHLFEAGGDFYGDQVEVAFVARLRDTMRFDGPGALVAQLDRDADAARLALTALDEPGSLNGSTRVPPSIP